MDRKEPAVGDLVDGRYDVSIRIGGGAAGIVFRAHDRQLDIDVALKVLRSIHVEKQDLLAQFGREADLAARMLSPHIARVLARGWTDAYGPHIVYELLEGEDLGQTLANEGRVPLELARTVVVHACRALARAHAIGVLHRDVKPSNLFISRLDDYVLVKMLDFGVAEIASGTGGIDGSTFVGTPEYVAPEVLFGQSTPDARSDLYALGVVAYECITGRLPFIGDTLGQLVAAHAKNDVPAATDLRGGVHRGIDVWLQRAIAADPDRRFASGKEMADALNEAFDNDDSSSSSIRRTRRAGAQSPPAPPAAPMAPPKVDRETPRSPESTRYIVIPGGGAVVERTGRPEKRKPT